MILFALTFAWCFFAQAHDMNAMCVYNADDSVHHVVANIDSITFGNSATEVSDEPAPTVGKAIDLGLSVKWASCNVGATAPEGYGDYYAWGETDTKSDYSWSTYIWCNGSGRTLTKYCTDSSYGNVDNKITLDSDDDVAHVEWGGSWRMPTLDEIKELKEKCSWQWITYKGVNGCEITGSNGNSIFLPAAGYSLGTKVYNRGAYGSYWTSTLICPYNNCACYLDVYGDSYDWYDNLLYFGRTVRPVSR